MRGRGGRSERPASAGTGTAPVDLLVPWLVSLLDHYLPGQLLAAAAAADDEDDDATEK